LFVIGIETQMLRDNDLLVGIDADLAIVAVIKVALLTPDARIGIGKADLLLGVDRLSWIKLGLPRFKCLFRRLDFAQPVLS
jgi:hypothetical protein